MKRLYFVEDNITAGNDASVCKSILVSLQLGRLEHTHKHTHTCVCMCVCVCSGYESCSANIEKYFLLTTVS